MTVAIKALRGIDPATAAKLVESGVSDSDQRLSAAASPKARRALAATVGARPKAVLQLANRADLARIRGIAGIRSDLLQHAGVDSVNELATRRSDYLHQSLEELNQAAELTGQLPSSKRVAD